jgi:hypothetical protein
VGILMQDAFFTDFSAGQLSRKLSGRFDSEIYSKGVQEIKNMVPLIPAGATLRPGTRYVGAPTAAPNLITWVISPTIVYLLEFTTAAIRVWRDNTYRTSITISPSISTADLASIQVAQTPKRLFLTLGTRTWAPKVITYTGVDTFTFADIVFTGNTGKVPFGSSGNYPSRVAIHEGRLFYASTANEPQKVWASHTGIFFYKAWSGSPSTNEANYYSIGDLITAVDPTKLAVYQCTTAGAAGSTEPTWPSSGTVADGTVVWTFLAAYYVDFYEFTEEIDTSWPLRPAAFSFTGDVADDSPTILNINTKIYAKLKVGDRLTGEGIRSRATLAFVGELATTSSISGIPSSIGNLLLANSTYGGEYIITDSISVPARVTNYDVSTQTLSFTPAGALVVSVGSTVSVRTGEIITYIDQKETSPYEYIVVNAYSVLDNIAPRLLVEKYPTLDKTGASLISGWHNPLISETEIKTTRTKTVAADSAFSFLLASDQCDDILWMASTRAHIVGTVTSERIIPPGTTALSLSCPRNTGYGSSDIPPIVIGDSVLFVDAAKTAVREYIFSQEQDGYMSPALSASAEGIFSSQIVKMDYQTSPVPIAWFLLANGTLAGCVLAKSVGIVAWFTVETEGTIESIAVLPVAGVDTLYLATLRHGVRGIERMLPLEAPGEHLDASVVGTVAAGAVSGLTHLAGQAVRVYYAGAVYDLTVSSGGVATIPAAIANGSSVLIGYGFEGIIGTMPPNPYGSNQMQAQKQKIAYSFYARVLDSYPFDAAPSETGAPHHAQLPPGETAPYSGDLKVPLLSNHSSDGSIWIIQPDPFDTTILAITAQVDTGGR